MPKSRGEIYRQLGEESTYRTIRTALERGNATVKAWHVGPVKPGARLRINKPHSWRVKYAANCTAPVVIHMSGRALAKSRKSAHVYGMGAENWPQFVEAEVPCRRCDNCLRRRGAHWRLRAVSEAKAAVRTWFGTLTLSPEQHFRVSAACRIAAARNGDDFDKFDTERQFAARHACISREITLYLKRIRKECAAEFKFCVVAEAHKTGLPHYHMLVHERDPLRSVRHKTLSGQWRVGFSQWKLVPEPNHVGYVTKYLAKSMLARVRASIDYGQTSLDIAPKVRETLTGNNITTVVTPLHAKQGSNGDA